MDLKLFEDALRSPPDVDPMAEKRVLFVQDQNGGSYNGQIQLDTSILSNSGMWNAYSEAYLEVPYQITFTSSVDVSAAGVINGYMAGLKCGNHQLIDSIQVSYNGTSVVQQQPYTNFHVSYKLMTSWSQDDVKKHGHITGMIPDTAGCHSYLGAASPNGDGISNNRVYSALNGAIPAWNLGASVRGGLSLSNEGLRERMKNTALPQTTNDNGYSALPVMNTAALSQGVGKNHVSDNGGVGNARVWTWNILATIRLKDLADFFDKMPITKGAYLTMTLNYNSSTVNITSAVVAVDVGLPAVAFNGVPAHASMVLPAASAITLNSGRTTPFIIASADSGNPNRSQLAGTLTFASSIGGSLLNQVRLYVPSYKLKPELEVELLKNNPKKKFKYCDIINYNVLNQTGNVRQILTNGIKNPKALVVIPQINSVANVGANINIVPFQSPFDSAPHTTCPLAAIDNFNVQLAGKNVFQQSFQYDFEAFKNEVVSISGIDGGSTVGMSSGLLGYFEWDNAYRYYVADLSRQGTLNEGIPQSVVLEGDNASGAAMDYYCFIEYEKEVEIDMITGQLLGVN